jgi:hypothetical protein
MIKRLPFDIEFLFRMRTAVGRGAKCFLFAARDAEQTGDGRTGWVPRNQRQLWRRCKAPPAALRPRIPACRQTPSSKAIPVMPGLVPGIHVFLAGAK